MLSITDGVEAAVNEEISNYPEEVYERTWVIIPILCSFGDFNQLPHVGMSAMSDLYSTIKLHTSDFQGILSITNFLNYEEVGTLDYTVLVDEMIIQQDHVFKSILHCI